jgi:hypothetical protein
MSSDPIGDALRADAEEARDEVRVSGYGLLRCPSCGQLAAEILGRGHCLILGGDGSVPWCECRDGKRVTLSAAEDFEKVKAAANVALADDFWFRSEAAMARLIIGNWEGRT